MKKEGTQSEQTIIENRDARKYENRKFFERK